MWWPSVQYMYAVINKNLCEIFCNSPRFVLFPASPRLAIISRAVFPSSDGISLIKGWFAAISSCANYETSNSQAGNMSLVSKATWEMFLNRGQEVFARQAFTPTADKETPQNQNRWALLRIIFSVRPCNNMR